MSDAELVGAVRAAAERASRPLVSVRSGLPYEREQGDAGSASTA
jgi:hypothetical protein